MLQSWDEKHPVVGRQVYVDERALVIGDVSIGDESSIWPMCVVRGDVQSIWIGERTNIQDGSVLHVTGRSVHVPEGRGLRVGSFVTVGHRVVLHACTIGDVCLIGMGSVVLDGAILESGVMVGAGSLVPPGKKLEAGYLWLGNPVRRARSLTESEIAYISWSADTYVSLAATYR